MAHERSVTSEGTPWTTPPPGRWVNTYGPGTLYEGQQLPGTPTYPDVKTADAAAALRSIMQNVSPGQASAAALPAPPAIPRKEAVPPTKGAKPIFSSTAKGNLRAQLGVDDPDSPGNALTSMGQTLGGAVKDWATTPIPMPYTDESGRLMYQGKPWAEAVKERPSFRDWLAGLGDIANMGIMGRGGMGQVPIKGREGLRQASKVFGSPELPESARGDTYLQKLLSKQTPWFHGTRGDPWQVDLGLQPQGQGGVPLVGEPSGVSLTPLLDVASKFGKDVYRVHPELLPEEVLRLYTPEGARDYRDFVRRSLDPVEGLQIPTTAIESLQRGTSRQTMPFFKWAEKYGYKEPGTPLAETLRGHADEMVAGLMGEKIRNQMRKYGYDALLYPPQRYGEYELRHLTPERVKMIERRLDPDQWNPEPDIYGDYPRRPSGNLYPQELTRGQIIPWAQAEPLFNPAARVKDIVENAIRERLSLPTRESKSGMQVSVPRVLAGDVRSHKFVMDHLAQAASKGMPVEIGERSFLSLPTLTRYEVYKNYPKTKIPAWATLEYSDPANVKYLEHLLQLQKEAQAHNPNVVIEPSGKLPNPHGEAAKWYNQPQNFKNVTPLKDLLNPGEPPGGQVPF